MEDFNELIVCGKSNYSNGQKKKFSGYMGNWTKSSETWYSNIKGVSEEKPVWYFFYRQPIIYHYNYLSEGENFSLSLSKKKKLLRERGDISYPHFSYSCRFMVGKLYLCHWNITTYRFYWKSGDDDIGNDFTFLIEDREKVMNFIKTHHMSLKFESKLSSFINENKYDRW